MIINPRNITLLLPIIFASHNIEEYLSYDKFADYYGKFIDQKFNNSKVFLGAISLLSAVTTLTVGLNYFSSNRITNVLTRVVFFSMFFNAMQHSMSSLFFRKILPGTITSMSLIIPYSIIFMMNLRKKSNFELKDFMLYSVTSIIFMRISILASLRFSYWLINDAGLFKKFEHASEEHQKLLETEEEISDRISKLQLDEPPRSLLFSKPLTQSLTVTSEEDGEEEIFINHPKNVHSLLFT